jgi:uroporphyrin-III C-methyltransferase
MSSNGRILLVGAGPGDPDLLTIRARRALEEADVVLYDALVSDRTVALARRARRLYVGKRRARHAVSQDAINRLLVRYAKRGLTVVRLKAGDPFVFGRGGEEALYAKSQGVAYEIVPGVTSAFAAPLAAGIPVTHRGVARGALVLTAVPDDTYKSVLPALSSAPITVVLMMALDRRAEIASFLVEHGWSAEHPAAIVLGATTDAEHVWTGTLAELGGAQVPEGPPGLLVLGESVRLSKELAPGAERDGADDRTKTRHDDLLGDIA